MMTPLEQSSSALEDLPALQAALQAAVGAAAVRDDWNALQGYLGDWAGRAYSSPLAVVFPASTEEVSALMKACAAHDVAVVPQGGNTGLVGGAAPVSGGRRSILLSLKRLDKVLHVDEAGYFLVAQAGAVLKHLQDAAAEQGMLFPLSLGAEGSCTLGGNISTNAGGNAVLRYGNMRELTLGMEVVLPDGRIWNGLRALRKDNTGYDLKQLFIGAEGTLGVVTAAAVKLFPMPRSRQTALMAVGDLFKVMGVFRYMRQTLGDQITAFELIPRLGIEFACRHIPGAQDPMAASHPWYILLEASASCDDAALHGSLEAALEQSMADGFVEDAVFASNQRQHEDLWKLREGMVESQKFEGASLKHDVSIPLAGIPDFIDSVCRAVEKAIPGVRPLMFGHVGDGNVHCNFSQPAGMNPRDFLAREHEVAHIVYTCVHRMNGSISAEHGIGQRKTSELERYKSEVELDLMRAVKHALDPANRVNPGKIIGESR